MPPAKKTNSHSVSSIKAFGELAANFSILLLALAGLALFISLPFLPFWIGYQIYFYQTTGRLDLSLPKIQFGTSKSVELCAEYLKQTSYAENVSINDGVIHFYVDYKFTLDNGPSTYNVEWGQQGNVMWSWVNQYVSNDVKSRCQGPVTVNYTYMYVKHMFKGTVVVPESQK